MALRMELELGVPGAAMASCPLILDDASTTQGRSNGLEKEGAMQIKQARLGFEEGTTDDGQARMRNEVMMGKE